MEWISVKDRLPEDGQYCIVAEIDYVYKGIMEYSDKYKYWIDSYGDRWTGMTHWMLLPEPPKAK